MVVGDEHLQAQLARGGHALDAGNAVVYSDQHIRATGFDTLCNGWREAIAIDHAIGHDVTNLFSAQQAQTAYGHSAGGGSITVVVRHDAQFFIGSHRIGQQHGGGFDAFQSCGRQQLRQRCVERGGILNAACGIQACQQRMHARLLQRPNAARWHVAWDELHGLSLSRALRPTRCLKKWGRSVCARVAKALALHCRTHETHARHTAPNVAARLRPNAPAWGQ